ISDRYFSSVLAQTATNRLYSYAGSSFGNIYNPRRTGGVPNLTVFDLLDQAGVTWRYYYQFSSPNWLPIFSVYYRGSNNVVPWSNFFTDVKNDATFPQVIFIEE